MQLSNIENITEDNIVFHEPKKFNYVILQSNTKE